MITRTVIPFDTFRCMQVLLAGSEINRCLTPAALTLQLAKMQSPMFMARNFAVIGAVQAGLLLSIKHARNGVEDWKNA